jgi:DNA-binding NtrC family response regulator
LRISPSLQTLLGSELLSRVSRFNQPLTIRADHALLGASVMARQPLVLLVPGDRLTGILTRGGLQGYGYDVLVAGSVDEALDLLHTNRRISVLVVNVGLEQTSDALALAKAARTVDPTIKIVYTCGAPNKLPDREKVTGAPCLRTPYHPHQLVGVIGQLANRPSFSGNELHAV